MKKNTYSTDSVWVKDKSHEVFNKQNKICDQLNATKKSVKKLMYTHRKKHYRTNFNKCLQAESEKNNATSNKIVLVFLQMECSDSYNLIFVSNFPKYIFALQN